MLFCGRYASKHLICSKRKYLKMVARSTLVWCTVNPPKVCDKLTFPVCRARLTICILLQTVKVNQLCNLFILFLLFCMFTRQTETQDVWSKVYQTRGERDSFLIPSECRRSFYQYTLETSQILSNCKCSRVEGYTTLRTQKLHLAQLQLQMTVYSIIGNVRCVGGKTAVCDVLKTVLKII